VLGRKDDKRVLSRASLINVRKRYLIPEQPMHETDSLEAATPPERPPLLLATKIVPTRLPTGLIDRPRRPVRP
jgi:hypothetical protein